MFLFGNHALLLLTLWFRFRFYICDVTAPSLILRKCIFLNVELTHLLSIRKGLVSWGNIFLSLNACIVGFVLSVGLKFYQPLIKISLWFTGYFWKNIFKISRWGLVLSMLDSLVHSIKFSLDTSSNINFQKTLSILNSISFKQSCFKGVVRYAVP